MGKHELGMKHLERVFAKQTQDPYFWFLLLQTVNKKTD